MKKRIQSLSFLATLAIAVGMISWGSALNAQSTSTPSDTQQPQAQQPSPDAPPAAQEPAPSQTPAQTPETTPSTQAPAQTPDQATTPTPKDATPADADNQVFSGTVVKSGDKYVLQDDAGKTYDIDHQDEVKKFEGKRVRVQGKLDDTGKKIMVK